MVEKRAQRRLAAILVADRALDPIFASSGVGPERTHWRAVSVSF